jgi:hypothetical protein
MIISKDRAMNRSNGHPMPVVQVRFVNENIALFGQIIVLAVIFTLSRFVGSMIVHIRLSPFLSIIAYVPAGMAVFSHLFTIFIDPGSRKIAISHFPLLINELRSIPQRSQCNLPKPP